MPVEISHRFDEIISLNQRKSIDRDQKRTLFNIPGNEEKGRPKPNQTIGIILIYPCTAKHQML